MRVGLFVKRVFVSLKNGLFKKEVNQGYLSRVIRWVYSRGSNSKIYNIYWRIYGIYYIIRLEDLSFVNTLYNLNLVYNIFKMPHIL